jgi:hypothetical protein
MHWNKAMKQHETKLFEKASSQESNDHNFGKLANKQSTTMQTHFSKTKYMAHTTQTQN